MEHYEWALPELEYPIDLSRGVLQFVDHRGKLEKAQVRVRLAELTKTLLVAAEAILGSGVDGRIRSLREGSQVELVVSIWSETSALSFDLVLGSSLKPRLVIDQPRGIGLEMTPLQASLHLLDAICRGAAASGVQLLREGRCLALASGLEAISLELLPALGCRIPEHGEPPLTEFSVTRGELEITLSHGERPLALGRKGLRSLGLAEATEPADTLLSEGHLDEARREYLRSLEDSPGCPEILLELARIDWLLSGHGESARGYLQDARERLERVQGEEGLAPGAEALLCAFEGEILLKTGRLESAWQSLKKAAELEPDPSLAGFLFFTAATIQAGDEARPVIAAELLDSALQRAPHLTRARWARVELLLSAKEARAGALELCARDVEYLSTMASEPEVRVAVLLRAAHLFFQAGATERALFWVDKALRLEPQHPEGQLLCAEMLIEGAEFARAIELLRSVGKILRTRGQSQFALSPREREQMDKASVLLAEVVARHLGDYAEALRAVAGVDSRSVYALEARRLECDFAQRLGEPQLHLRALEKILQGFELGWFQLGAEPDKSISTWLEALAEQASKVSPPDVAARFATVLQNLSSMGSRLENSERSSDGPKSSEAELES